MTKRHTTSAKLPVIVNSQENPFDMRSYVDPPDCPSWDALPWPPLERICHYLFNTYDGTDLSNLAKVSDHYNNGVMKFMCGPNHLPGIRSVRFANYGVGVKVSIRLFRSNLSFYLLDNLDEKRLKRSNSSTNLEVVLRGSKDPIIEKVIILLSTSIKDVDLWRLSSQQLSMCEQLLRASTIDRILFMDLVLKETTA
ncbi:hypothetical protein PMAYCL1PPCAC_03478 [Pristionchus mayeri]|uniref:Uncharacterized protein n=1 Tax=Pristionchus mayeri TaxID=1317129 RepID=A0AAN4Z7B4_9BILA|nr:hypothetical protein PMAYCL1PPCAC_03478 [Pristionchus mayeri]